MAQSSVRYDPLMSALLQEMTRQPTPHSLQPWQLNYIPPKHLRMPGFDYGDIEESTASTVPPPQEARAPVRLHAPYKQIFYECVEAHPPASLQAPNKQIYYESVCDGKRQMDVTEQAIRLVRAASKGSLVRIASQGAIAPCASNLWTAPGSRYTQRTQVARNC